MLTYHHLSQRPKHFTRLTGITLTEFGHILPVFSQLWQQSVTQAYLAKDHQRAFGGGRQARLLTVEDKLLFVLVYVRIYPLLLIHGLMFNLAESKTCEWVHRLLPILDDTLGVVHARPHRHQGRSLTEILREFPELKELGILTDGTERPIRRPKDQTRRTDDYSGKKKRHTHKNLVTSHPRSTRILSLSQTYPGRSHDKTIFEQEHRWCRDPVKMGGDLAFQGLAIPNIRFVLPAKKPRGRDLSDELKEQNRALSSVRVKVEHAICGAKRNRSVQDVYRNVKAGVDDLFMSIACGLHNLRIAHRFAH